MRVKALNLADGPTTNVGAGSGPRDERIVSEFAAADGGHILVLSDDHSLTKALRHLLTKEIAIPSTRVRVFSDNERFFEGLKDPDLDKRPLLLIVERSMHGMSCMPIVQQLSQLYQEQASIIVLTYEVPTEHLAMAFECGAKSVVVKPATMGTMLSKIANAIAPQGKLGVRITEAKGLLARKLYDPALVMAKVILEEHPDSATAYMIRGDALRGRGDAEGAREAYQQASNCAPMYLEPLKRLASLSKDFGDTEGRRSYLERLDSLSPLNVQRKVDLGDIYLSDGDRDKARECFEEAMHVAKQEALTRIEELRTCIAEKCMLKAPEMAEDFFRALLEGRQELGPGDIAIFNRLGLALRRQKRWKDAVVEYQKALAIKPDDETVLFNMAMAYADGGNHAEALKCVECALKSDPHFHTDSCTVSFNIAVMYTRAQRNAEAEQFLRAALAIDPDHERAKALLDKLAA